MAAQRLWVAVFVASSLALKPHLSFKLDGIRRFGAQTMLETPVAFLIFNRPDLTARVFEAIAARKPSRLLVVADGPRNESKAKLCAQARAVVERVDWDCQVEKNFSEVNLGCGARVSSGLDWVFERAEAAIILEDDCLPSPSFFAFCAEMLERYRDDERVMHVSGDNFAPLSDGSADYGFSRYVHVWGWATWRRAWRHYDAKAACWPAVREAVLASCADATEKSYWDAAFGGVFRGEINTWDFQWALACWVQSGLAIVPRVNLVTNLGFRADATHTGADSALANLPAGELQVERHPRFVMRAACADQRERKLLMPALPGPAFGARGAGPGKLSVVWGFET